MTSWVIVKYNEYLKRFLLFHSQVLSSLYVYKYDISHLTFVSGKDLSYC